MASQILPAAAPALRCAALSLAVAITGAAFMAVGAGLGTALIWMVR